MKPMRITPLSLAFLGLVAWAPSTTACLASSSGAADKSTVVVPSQPPQPSQPLAPSPSSTPVVLAAGPSFKCENGKRFEVGLRSYCAYAEADTWASSEQRCVANGGHLMTLDTEDTSQALHQTLGSPITGAGRAAWMGLELKKGKGGRNEWTWAAGDVLAASSWNAGEPNNFDGNERCAEWLVVDGRWNDTRCTLRQPYLCQAKSDKRLSCSGGRAFSAGEMSYCLNVVERSFADAARACAADGGGLAVLRTGAENQTVLLAMAARFAATKMWIGLTDAADEGTWSWVSGAPINFEAWLPGEPNNFNREDCAELHADSWTWNDMDCSMKLPSVCESPAKRR